MLLLPSDWVPVSLDDRTAQKLLWISEGGAKVARTSDAVCPYPNRPERYEHSPQVDPGAQGAPASTNASPANG